MTTTLRPTEPLQHAADGTRSRRYQVCVNSRPVGAVRLGTDPNFGTFLALFHELRINEPDRGRGRGTVAALAAEEVARGWGCKQIELSVPGDAEAGLRLAEALGYVTRNRRMEKLLGDTSPEMPAGSLARPMTQAEYEVWDRHGREDFAQDWIERGLPEREAYAKSNRDHDQLMPQGLDTQNMWFTVLEHEGTPVGDLWLGERGGRAFVYNVQVDAAHRGRGHGRTLMLLAEVQAVAAGVNRIGLNVFSGNAPAERLYESLGYRTTERYLYKDLL
ncbi:GNAT family N-acetyltransferase [Streptomyces sp. NPDC050564]|uniref:GNAT family N-acetyltransferase n=1 Tax=Streptomyces sp. NPDC050564 TaxID=3365631 RepID=UPI0037A7031C